MPTVECHGLRLRGVQQHGSSQSRDIAKNVANILPAQSQVRHRRMWISDKSGEYVGFVRQPSRDVCKGRNVRKHISVFVSGHEMAGRTPCFCNQFAVCGIASRSGDTILMAKYCRQERNDRHDDVEYFHGKPSLRAFRIYKKADAEEIANCRWRHVGDRASAHRLLGRAIASAGCFRTTRSFALRSMR